MESYSIQADGTKEDLKRMEEVFEEVGLCGSFDENGTVEVDESYSFGFIGHVESAARALVSAAPNAKFIFSGFLESDVSGEIQDFEMEYDTHKLNEKCSGWYYPDVNGSVENSEGESEEDWDYTEEINIEGKTEVKIQAVVANVTEQEDFGALLLADLPLDIDPFSDAQPDFQGDEGRISISAVRFVADKSEVDNFAESLGVVMPNSIYVVVAEFNGSETFKYSYEGGKIVCEKEISEDVYEEAEMVSLTEEQKEVILSE